MNIWHQWHMAAKFRDVQLKHRWYQISKPFRVAPWCHMNHMTNHWSSQQRHQSTDQIILLWLIWRICNHSPTFHQATTSRVSYVNFTVRSGVVAMFCPDYCHQMCPELFKQNLQLSCLYPSTCSDLQVLSMSQVCNASSPTHILALNNGHLFQRNLTFPRCGEESTTCSTVRMMDPKKDHPVTKEFLWGLGNKEPMNLLVETRRNNKIIMLSCVTARRINRFQFSEVRQRGSGSDGSVLDGRHTNLSQLPAWQLP